MQGAVGVRDAIALAQGVEVIALARMRFFRHHEGVGHSGNLFAKTRQLQPCQLGIQKRQIKRRVVNDDLGAADKFDQFARHLGEPWFVRQKLARQSVHLERRFVAVALRIQVVVKIVAGEPAVHQFDATDLNHAMAMRRVKASRFGIQNDLPHRHELYASAGCSRSFYLGSYVEPQVTG